MSNTLHHLASLFRSLFRKPGFALAVILTLTIGIGANTATLSLLYGYLLAPLPYPQAQQLVNVYFTAKKFPRVSSMSYTTYFDLRKQATAMSDAGMYQMNNLNLVSGAGTMHVRGATISASLFTTLGVQPLVGRVFGPDANQVGAPGQVVLSYSLWSRLFNRNPDVIGRTLRLNNTACTVVGIMPKSFTFPDAGTDLWVPQTFDSFVYEKDNLTAWGYTMIARLKPGASLRQLNTQNQAVLENEIAHFPYPSAIPQLQKAGMRIVATPLRTALVGDLNQRLILVQLATGLLLLLVWFNLANLFIVRALTRRGELILRRVLGADTRTLFAQLFAESLTLCVIGGIAGLILGEILLRTLLHTGFGTAQLAFPVNEWGSAIGIAAVLAIISALVFSLAGLYFIRHQDLGQALREGDARASGGHNEHRVRAGLVVTQLVLACVLTGIGAMLAQSLIKLNNVRLGFQPEQLITFQVHVPASVNQKYLGPPLEAKLASLHRAFAQVPGVASVTLANDIPFDEESSGVEAYPYPYDEKHSQGVFPVITDPSYFKTFGIPVLSGREFIPQDAHVPENYAVIDVKAAESLFGTTNVLGRQLNLNSPNDTKPNLLYRVIGVVANTHRDKLGSAELTGSLYIDREQVLQTKTQNWSFAAQTWYVAVRTPLSTTAILSALTRAAAQTLPGIPIYDVRSMNQRLSNQLAPRRGLMTLVLMFALGALLLAAVGLYAVQSYTVSQRLREFGIRAALGADRGQLLSQVLREIARLLAIGLIVGLMGVVLFGHVFSSALYDVNMADPVSLFLVFVILSFTALAAGWIPAWRASRVPPMEALRE
ncbi:MAG: ABC transporter permease [Gammaproteobacteria bacterium]|nr:ABC transporter permease [Gammaproteobacteria bacterium]